MGGIEGGGGHEHLHFQPDAEVIGEIAQENAELIEKHTGAKVTRDTVQKSNEEAAKLPAYLATDPDNPALPPGLSDVKIKEKLDGVTAGHKEIAAKMMGDIPESSEKLGQGTVDGLKDGVNDIAKVSAASSNYLSGVEGMQPIPTSEQVANLKVGGPGPVDPSSSPLQQNTQVLINDAAFLENTSRIIGGEAAEMPDGPQKESLMGFLASIDAAIADLKGILDKIQQGEGVTGKEGMGKAAVTDLADWNAKAAKRQEEAEKAKDEGKGGPFGDLTDSLGLGALGDMSGMDFLSESLDFGGLMEGFELDGLMEGFELDGLMDGLKLDGLTEGLGLDSFGGIFEGDLMGGIGDFLTDPGVIMAVVGSSIGTAVFPYAVPWSTMLGAGLGLMLGGMLGGEDSMSGGMLNDTPLVGDLLGEDGIGGTMSGVVGGIPIIGDLFGGGGGSSSKGASRDEIKDRIASRRASQGTANGAVSHTVAKRGAELDGVAEENAELAADIQKLIQLLMAMKNGGDPAAMSGELSELLNKIGGADVPGLQGHDAFFSQMQQAAGFAESGDYDAMIESIDKGFQSEGYDTDKGQRLAQNAISDVFSPVAGADADDFGDFSILSGAA